jgi:uncharacterized protein YwqG
MTASIVKVGGFRPTGDPLASHFGLKPLGRPDENWPHSAGAPMLFVCQLNLTAAPVVPPLLNGIALIAFFVDPKLGNLEQENGTNWQLRTYTSFEGLIPLTPPSNAPSLKKGFECRWEEAADEDGDLAFTKIGGYPSEIQSEPWWDYQAHPAEPQFCLQINSEEKVGLFWGDAGMVYLARGTADGCQNRWFLDWQCY